MCNEWDESLFLCVKAESEGNYQNGGTTNVNSVWKTR